MFWFALHMPLLSLEAFCASLPQDAASRPVALVAGHKISAVNPAAARCGVRPGLKRPIALALASDLLLAQANTASDAAALQAVVHAALAFTPSVTVHDSHTVLLEVQSSLRLFGGAAALLQHLLQAVLPLGHQLQVAAAPTAWGAALLARWHSQPGPSCGWAAGPHTTGLPALRRLLDGVPVHLLGPGREHWDALQGMGLHTLAELRQMPRTGLARRFGDMLLTSLDRAYGLQPDPRCWVLPAETFDSRLELFARADSTEQVLHGAVVLLSRLVAWAQARQSRVCAFTLCMHHEPRHRDAALPPTTLQVQLADPALDPAHLQLLLRERLAHIVLPAPTLELRLQCSQLVQAAPPNGELFRSRSSQGQGMTQLLERLRARLGDTQVQQLKPVADHRPERATLAVPVQAMTLAAASSGSRSGKIRTSRNTTSNSAAGSASTQLITHPITHTVTQPITHPTHQPSTLPMHRPVWLLPDPLPLTERASIPQLDGRPLQLLSGPERIEAGWWDGDVAVRDYYIAQAADGSLVWVWRGRLQEQSGDVGWYLQGRYG